MSVRTPSSEQVLQQQLLLQQGLLQHVLLDCTGLP
jgi:hypothetical protein